MAESDFEMQLYPYLSTEALHSETPDTERASLADTAHFQYWFDWPTDRLNDWSVRSNESSHSEALDTSGVLLADTDPWGSSTDLGAPYMPLLSSETSNTEASNTETSDTTPEGPTADTVPSQPSTDLEAQRSTSASTAYCRSYVFAGRIGLLVLGLLFLLAKFTISHFAVIFLAWFFGITNAGYIWWAHVICYIFDTIFWVFAICKVGVEIEDEGLVLVMPEGGSELLVVARDYAWFALGGGPVLFCVALPIVAVVVLWSALLWFLSAFGWVLSSLGLL